MKIYRISKIYDWVNMDWRRQNVDIANELGVLENNVSRARKQYAPETIRTRRQTASSLNWYRRSQ